MEHGLKVSRVAGKVLGECLCGGWDILAPEGRDLRRDHSLHVIMTKPEPVVSRIQIAAERDPIRKLRLLAKMYAMG